MILVTGANGMVGSYVKQIFDLDNTYLTDIPEMDVTDPAKVQKIFDQIKPRTVVHLAAKTDVDKCETEIDDAYKTNALGTLHVVLACKKIGATLVYISTGGVFGGNQADPYTEFDEPNPPTVYSRSKYEGEKFVRANLHNHYILRAGWMIGGGEKDKKFVGKMVSLFSERDEILAVNDKIGTITYALHLVKMIKQLINTGLYGTYHVVSEGACSRFDIAQEIAKIIGSKAKIVPVGSDRFPLPAPRGISEAMRNYKLDLLELNTMPKWQEALREYLASWDYKRV
ncbi:MAG: dTDP-4-dehydrorhamnose reductase [Candidatus Vogelbacteria bacterium]|nr:dTDP-4-dehydrorhamnose reductase [Candidatus Vogelbacteria bacterium]